MKGGFDRTTWQRLWHLARPFFVSEIRWRAWGLLLLLVCFSLAVTGMNYLISIVMGGFMNAFWLRQKAEFLKQTLLLFAGLRHRDAPGGALSVYGRAAGPDLATLAQPSPPASILPTPRLLQVERLRRHRQSGSAHRGRRPQLLRNEPVDPADHDQFGGHVICLHGGPLAHFRPAPGGGAAVRDQRLAHHLFCRETPD